MALTDANAKLAAFYEYDAWGNVMTEAEKSGVDNPYRYSTKEWDEKSGLYYFGARYYSPEIGRWTQRDPAGTVDGLNLYVYADNQPSVNIDAWGLIFGCAQEPRWRIVKAGGVSLTASISKWQGTIGPVSLPEKDAAISASCAKCVCEMEITLKEEAGRSGRYKRTRPEKKTVSKMIRGGGPIDESIELWCVRWCADQGEIFCSQFFQYGCRGVSVESSGMSKDYFEQRRTGNGRIFEEPGKRPDTIGPRTLF